MQNKETQNNTSEDNSLFHYVKRFVFSEMQPKTQLDIEAANALINEIYKEFVQGVNCDQRTIERGN